jgi:anti-sigma factor RsiW
VERATYGLAGAGGCSKSPFCCAYSVAGDSRSSQGGGLAGEFAAGIVDAHLRSLLPAQLSNVNSSDPETVRAWFDSKVKFIFSVRDFTDDDFALRGGRVDIVQGRTVAALVYRDREQSFNVFIWRTRESDGSAHAGSRQGHQWIDWRKDQLEFCIVSDAAPADLGLQRLLSEQRKYGAATRMGAQSEPWTQAV